MDEGGVQWDMPKVTDQGANSMQINTLGECRALHIGDKRSTDD
jgi:hypothetical protein